MRRMRTSVIFSLRTSVPPSDSPTGNGLPPTGCAQDVLDDLAITDDERMIAINELEAAKKEREQAKTVSAEPSVSRRSDRWQASFTSHRHAPLARAPSPGIAKYRR